MPGDIYSVYDVVDKTLWAETTIPVYSTAPPYFAGGKTLADYKIGVVLPGNPVGKVYSYQLADPTKGRNNIWWVFKNTDPYGNALTYYVEHGPGKFDVGALRDQGVISLEEKAENEADANLPWYERVIKNAGKSIMVVAGIGLAIYAIGTAFKMSKSNGNAR